MTGTSVTVSVLGPLSVEVEGRPVELTPARRRLVAILALSAGDPIDTGSLIHRMWPGTAPTTARTVLQVHVSRIRRVAPGLIETVPNGYRMEPGVQLDAVRFEALSARLDRTVALGKGEEVLALCDEALGLWRAEPFPELAGETFAMADMARLIETYHRVEYQRLEALLEMGLNDLAVARASEMVARHPLDERFREGLMLALYRCGRQVEAIGVYQSARRHLADELGLEPGPGLRALEGRILAQDPTLGSVTTPATPHNLPPFATSFLGRRLELETISEALSPGSVVSIVGAPGVGKTRLAVEAATGMLGRFPGGVWFVELGGTATAVSVASTVTRATRTTESVSSLESLGAVIGGRPVLLLLDECEEVTEHVTDLLRGLCSGATAAAVLATSRRALDVPNEFTLNLGRFERGGDSAVRLMADRIRAVDRTFLLTEEAFSSLEVLADEVDGVPLALEVMSCWVRSLGIEVTSRLLDRVRAKSALEATLDWSLRMLHESDWELLSAVSVFAGPTTLERIHAVCSAEDRAELITAGGVARLVESFLLGAEGPRTGEVRYRMLGPVRDRVVRRAGIRQDLRLRHAEEFRSAASEVAAAAGTQAQIRVFAAVDSELPEYRRAMETLRQRGDWEGVVAIAGGLSRFWYARFLAWEGRVWLEEALSHLDSEPVGRRARLAAGFLAWAVHDYETADRHYRVVMEEGRSVGDRRMVAEALYGLGLIHQKRRFEDGGAMLEEAAERFRSLPDCDLQLGQCLLYRGLDQVGRGGTARGVEMLEEAVERLSRVGHVRQVSKAHRWLAHAAWLEGDTESSGRHVGQAEELARRAGDQPALAGALLERGFLEISRGETEVAASLLIEALDLIPEHDLVDVCQVLEPVSWLAEARDECDLAVSILGFIDEVYERAGWLPADTRLCHRRLRERLLARGVGESPPRDEDLPVPERVRVFLSGIARGP